MKFHWGHGIFLFFVLFVGALVFVLVASMQVDHSLVYDDYYAKDLAYQEYYDKAEAGLRHESYAFDFDSKDGVVTIVLGPDKDISGTVTFYRASAKNLDFQMPITESRSTISTREMMAGKWKMTVEWTEDGKTYLREEQIFI